MVPLESPSTSLMVFCTSSSRLFPLTFFILEDSSWAVISPSPSMSKRSNCCLYCKASAARTASTGDRLKELVETEPKTSTVCPFLASAPIMRAVAASLKPKKMAKASCNITEALRNETLQLEPTKRYPVWWTLSNAAILLPTTSKPKPPSFKIWNSNLPIQSSNPSEASSPCQTPAFGFLLAFSPALPLLLSPCCHCSLLVG